MAGDLAIRGRSRDVFYEVLCNGDDGIAVVPITHGLFRPTGFCELDEVFLEIGMIK